MNTVVLISASAEWEAVKPIFPGAVIQNFPFGESMDVEVGTWKLKLFHSGWGKIASAGSMQYVIDHASADLIVNLGTCGGINGVVDQDDLILVEETIVYDTMELMGDPISHRITHPNLT